MNKRIRELARQAGFDSELMELNHNNGTPSIAETFAELIVQECIKECKQEWYELNAESIADSDPFRNPRATGIRVGQKNGILKCISKIKQHFGVEQ